MLPLAGKTAGPIGLKFFVDTQKIKTPQTIFIRQK